MTDTDELARNWLVARSHYHPFVGSEVERDAALLQELYSAGTLVAVLVNEELEAAGVQSELFSFVGWVYALEPITPGNLAAETGLPATTVRDYVRRLLERGDVRKVPNPEDGRSYHLVLTAKGRRLSERGWPAVVAAFGRLAPHLDHTAGEHLRAVEELRGALKLALAEGARGGTAVPPRPRA
jgi:DNA-binding MarR family transcriptional regulator